MPNQPIYQVDAFTSTLFRGNPAAVCPLEDWLPVETMQSIASENNLSETAFFCRQGAQGGADFHLRWFTPETEVQLCGHATLASAHVLFEPMAYAGEAVRFSTEHAGILTARRAEGGMIRVDLPARGREKIAVPPELVAALGRSPQELYRSGYNLMAVFENKRDVHELAPSADRLRKLDAFGVIVTAPGASHDFISRYFAPKAGVVEDPVTGSAHCSLAPYWGERLGKTDLTAHQVSKRGGELRCTLEGDRVGLTGGAVMYMQGAISTG
ncbi:MAG: PhzF family phenazine biosynthesis isomerase [Phycisphaerales bacterium]|nr:MAG: PhzF family phenazine biosynthesis isomerase [Phycisphaerales bacterium]